MTIPAQQPSAPASSRPTVLIVDDNEIMRSLLKAILREEPYEVVGEARDGVSALESLARLTPDIVLLDVVMPEIDGIEVLRNTRRDYPDTAVIMVTGNASAENVQEALKSGAAGFVVKPFNAAKVMDALTRVRRTLPRFR
ncbi:two-component system, chemotaxis family, response regulator [Oryzomicrobium terrae]|uniref:Two-component system, chemotaxis family, response regulator n=1 Tax=Oryzomicrobium terrae TaxID=1735038 RepID=A0A5C1E752_9RHOO|nr:response regulator [Oryzomicrobium terrae]QEL64683.1 two-component system, chemotaxis family, response regulator [Oryzomicrobium terrae]